MGAPMYLIGPADQCRTGLAIPYDRKPLDPFRTPEFVHQSNKVGLVIDI